MQAADVCSVQGTTRKRKDDSSQFMHLARVKDIDEDDAIYAVSFLKRQADGSYCWPEPEDNSSVDIHGVVKMGCPQEDIISGASSTVRVKLTFDKNHINGARLAPCT